MSPQETYRIVIVNDGVKKAADDFRSLATAASKAQEVFAKQSSAAKQISAGSGKSKEVIEQERAERKLEQARDKQAKADFARQKAWGQFEANSIKKMTDTEAAEIKKRSDLKAAAVARELGTQKALGGNINKLGQAQTNAIIEDKKRASDKIAAILKEQRAQEMALGGNINKLGKSEAAANVEDRKRAADQIKKIRADQRAYETQIGNDMKRIYRAENQAYLEDARRTASAKRKIEADAARARRDEERRLRSATVTHNSAIDDVTALGSSLYFFKRALATIGVFQFTSQLIEMSDAAKSAQNRLRNLVDSEAELGTVTKQLRGIADETRTGFADTTEIYSRMAFATQGLGYSQQQLLNVTKSLNQAVLLSGARRQEATAALIQFSQALGSNRLGGDEFRAVAEQLPFVMKTIADSLGVPQGRLKELAKQGKLTTKVLIDAFVNAADTIEQKAKKVAPTIEQSFTVFKNRLLYYIADVDTAVDGNSRLANAILLVSKNIDILGKTLGTLILAFSLNLVVKAIVALVAGLGPAITGMVRLGQSFLFAAQGMITWQVAAANSAKAFAVVSSVLYVVLAALIIFGSQLKINKDLGTTWGDVWVQVWKSVGRGIKGAWEDLKNFNAQYAFFAEHSKAAAVPVTGAPVGDSFKGIGPKLPDLSEQQNFVLKIADILDALINLPRAVGTALKLMFDKWASELDLFLNSVQMKFDTFILGMLTKLQGSTTVFAKMIPGFAEGLDAAIQITEQRLASGAHYKVLAETAAAQTSHALTTGLMAGFLPDDKMSSAVRTWAKGVMDKANLAANMRKAQADADLNKKKNVPDEDAAGKLDKWNKYIQRLRDELTLLKMIGSERDKAIAKATLSAQREFPELAARPLTKQSAERLGEVQSNAAAQFDAKADQSVMAAINKLVAERGRLQILDTEQRKIQEMLDSEAEKAQRPLLDFEIQMLTLQQKGIDLLNRRNSAYQEIVDPMNELRKKEEVFTDLFRTKAINADQFAQKIRDIHADMSALSNTIKGGVTNGLDRMRQRANELGATVSNIVVAAFDGLTDVVDKFVEKGKVGFRDLVDLLHDLLRQLATLATNQLFARLLGGATDMLVSQAGGSGTGIPVGGFGSEPTSATGRTVGSGYGPQGSNQQSQQTQPAEVHVHITNVLSEKEMHAAMESAAGRRVIWNVLSRDPAMLAQLQGG